MSSTLPKRLKDSLATRPDIQITHTRDGRQSLAPVDINTPIRTLVMILARDARKLVLICNFFSKGFVEQTIICSLTRIQTFVPILRLIIAVAVERIYFMIFSFRVIYIICGSSRSKR